MWRQNLHNQLRGLSQYSWEGWDDAANYLLQEKIDLDEALKYSDKSIQNEARYDNFMTKSQVLDALGRKDEATTARNKALTMANAIQIHSYARQLQMAARQTEAFAIYPRQRQKESGPVDRARGPVAHVFRPGRLRKRSQRDEHGAWRGRRRGKNSRYRHSPSGWKRRRISINSFCGFWLLASG